MNYLHEADIKKLIGVFTQRKLPGSPENSRALPLAASSGRSPSPSPDPARRWFFSPGFAGDGAAFHPRGADSAPAHPGELNEFDSSSSTSRKKALPPSPEAKHVRLTQPRQEMFQPPLFFSPASETGGALRLALLARLSSSLLHLPRFLVLPFPRPVLGPLTRSSSSLPLERY